MRLKIRYIYLLFPLITLAGCVSMQPAPEKPANEVKPVEERRAEIKTVQSFDLNGAIAVRNPKKSWTASINWLQKGASWYEIRLFGPVGSGTVMVSKKGNNVVLQDGAKRVSSNNAAKLLEQETGVSLPVHHLFYWVRALPAPGSTPRIRRDRYNHIEQLRQGGYTVRYLKYTSTAKGDLPSSIRLEGRGIKVKLIIKRWKV